MIKRVYIEKKEENRTLEAFLKEEFTSFLKVELDELRVFARYDVQVEGLPNQLIADEKEESIFPEELPPLEGYSIFAIEFLQGGYDQREDFLSQQLSINLSIEKPLVSYATVYAIKNITDEHLEIVKKHLINPVESKEAALEKPSTLQENYPPPEPTRVITGFKDFSQEKLKDFHKESGVSLTLQDINFVKDYFAKIHRDPTETELKAIDTYWSDHCRHSTFFTHIKDVKIKSSISELKAAYKKYQELFNSFYKNKPEKYQSLMDMATMPQREIKRRGKLEDKEESKEINACSVFVPVEIDGKEEKWLLSFKNETHNHPTEIEPYGGAATALGGGIRDPLSGRSTVFHSMRVTGAADINAPFSSTLKNKLPQRYLTKTAADGFSSYANLVGLAGGVVQEYYHKGYAAKRMEAGFTVGAAPASDVKREEPQCGDVVLYIGGATGRDGCGGATGSSVSHTRDSIAKCSAEVQKGTPTMGRAIGRLFANPEFRRKIKRSNDFGAGGVSVAVGELADSLDIFLDRVPVKYPGLSATEIAISESQERMAVVVCKSDANSIIKLAQNENLEAVEIATVTDTKKVRIFSGEEVVYELDRDFLNSNGVTATATATVTDKKVKFFSTLTKEVKAALKSSCASALLHSLSLPNVASQKGMGGYFESTVGGGSIFVPFGGLYQDTPAISCAALFPVKERKTTTASVAANGYDPDLFSQSAFTGAVYATLVSIIKVAITGTPLSTIRLTFQEYFERLKDDPVKWGKPVSALMGALHTSLALDIPSIGGKDSMSGTYEDITVPPTLISFAIGVANAGNIITNVLEKKEQKVYRFSLPKSKNDIPNIAVVKKFLDKLYLQIAEKKVNFANVVEQGGVASAVIKSCFGNRLGFNFVAQKNKKELFLPHLGDIIFSADSIEDFSEFNISLIGETTASRKISFGIFDEVTLADALRAFNGKYETVFPTHIPVAGIAKNISFNKKSKGLKATKKVKAVQVLIPILPDTNSEFDIERKFLRSGAEVKKVVIKEHNLALLAESIKEFISELNKSQILVLPSGYSAVQIGTGSDRFITALLSRDDVEKAVKDFVKKQDGLILGINSGFKALLKLGYFKENSASLSINNIGRYVSGCTRVKVSSNLSPWLSNAKTDTIYTVPLSVAEGRLTAPEESIAELIKNGQVALQFVDENGNATLNNGFNLVGSQNAIAALTSPCGKIFGSVVAIERINSNTLKNVTSQLDELKIFCSAVEYFK